MQATAFLKKPGDHETGPIVAIYGSERFLKTALIRALCEKVLGTVDDDLSLKRIVGKQADLAEVLDTLRTVSMWNPRQLVIVEDADEFVSANRPALERYLDKPAKKSVLVLEVKSWPATTRLAKKTAEIGLPLDCAPLKAAELTTWIAELAKNKHGKKIDREAAARLVELAGTDLGLLDQEVAKLASFVGDRPGIDLESVQGLVGGWKMETTWKMIDAINAGQVGAALQLLDKLLLAGEHPLKLLGGINFTYRPLAQATELARQGTSLSSALTQAGVKPFNMNSATAYLKRIGRPRAEQILQWLLQADFDLKGGSELPDRVTMERLLMRLAGAA